MSFMFFMVNILVSFCYPSVEEGAAKPALFPDSLIH